MRVMPTVLFALVPLAGCGADKPAGAVVRDSAGVVIVENERPAWGAGEGWTVAASPEVDIGVLDGAPEYQLFRAWSAARLSDGRIVVANGGTGELRFYDSAGLHLRSVGREGEGPGEFRDLQRVWPLPGDSLLAYDFFPSRLSVFSPAGEFVRSLHVAAPDGRQVIIRGAWADGSLVVQGAPIWGAAGATSGVVRDSAPFYHHAADGTLRDTLGVFPSLEVFRIVTGDDWTLTSLPFPRIPVSKVAGDGFYFGPAESYEIRAYGADGALERVIRLGTSPRAVTSADIERFRSERLDRAEREGSRASMERMLAQMPLPETMPPYRQLEVDTEGYLWVADYRVAPDEPPTWNVFSPDGHLLGSVVMPAGLTVLQIGRDFVLGSWLDEFDTEHIRQHPLTRR